MVMVLRRKKDDVDRRNEAQKETSGLKSERNELTADEILWGAHFRMQHQKDEPQLQDFKGVYPDTEIAADTKALEDKERRYQNERDERAVTLEAFLSSDEVSKANWFGSKEAPLHIQRVTRFDDSFTGVDSIWEWQRPEDLKVVRLAFDATSASDETTLFEKLDRMQRSVQNKTLGKVKYFRSDLPGSPEPGRVEQIPHVVIGTDAEGIQRLAKDYMPLITARDALTRQEAALKKAHWRDSDLAEKKKQLDIIQKQQVEIARDPLPLMILDQIESQLSLQVADAVGYFFRDYGRRPFGDPATSETMATVRSNLSNLLLKHRDKQGYGLELERLMSAVKEALPAIGKIDPKRAGELTALHDTLSFIKGVVEEKKKNRREAAPALPEAKRKTNQVLSDKWSPYVNSQME